MPRIAQLSLAVMCAGCGSDSLNRAPPTAIDPSTPPGECDSQSGFTPSVAVLDKPGRVAFGPEHAAVVWAVWNEVAEEGEYWARFVELDGTSLGPPVRLAEGLHSADTYAIRIRVVTPSSYLFVWKANDASEDPVITIAEVNVDGSIVHRREVVTVGADMIVAAVEQAGEDTVIALNSVGVDAPTMHLLTLDAAGSAVTVDTIGTGNLRAMRWNGDVLGVLWRTREPETDDRHYVGRVSEGTLVEATLVSEGRNSYLPGELCWDGAEFAITLDTLEGDLSAPYYRSHFARVGGPGLTAIAGDSTHSAWAPSITCAGSTYGMAWQQNAPSQLPGTDLVVSHIAFTELGSAGSPRFEPVPVERSDDSISMLPHVRVIGGAYHVTWTDWSEQTGYVVQLASLHCDR